jgi:phenylalanyl-tRNA synthetase beta chain
MKVSLEWLQQYVDIDISENALADRLTMAGLEVEAVVRPHSHLDGVVVGKITEVRPHPDADRLSCCRVDAGSQTLEIVCGAPNAAAGMYVPCATTGTVLPSGMEIKKTRIRGQTSEGMLCSQTELGLGEDASGLMHLGGEHAAGTPIARALGLEDTVFEIGLTPNRPDCLSHIGVAREIAALLGKKLHLPEIPFLPVSGDIAQQTSVTIENPELCPRYAARLVSDITVGPSPQWLRRRLRAVGLKPINNIVDITNYVMMETGQPLHGFDFERLAEKRIVVRTPDTETEFTTLDGKPRQLDADTLLICDGKKPVAIAGVMGGENSEILETTSRVLIESACFDPVSIRKTAKRLGISTDASYRFERGVDPDGTVYAIQRAAVLMAELGGGQLIGSYIDEHPRPPAKSPIRLSTRRTNQHLGTGLSQAEITDLLQSAAFEIQTVDADQLAVTAPSYRVDVFRPEDLMEEVARLWGYNRIATTFPGITAQAEAPGKSLSVREQIRDRMEGFGFHETIHYSFISHRAADHMLLPEDDPRRRTEPVLNPLTEDQSVMRTSLLPALLETVQKNIFRQEKTLKFFEQGKAFYHTQPGALPREIEMLAALWTGLQKPLTWHAKPIETDFYDLKGVAEALLAALGITDGVFSALPASACSYTQPGQTAQIRCKDTFLGIIGEIRPAVLEKFDIRQPIFALELHMEALVPIVPEATQFVAVPKFPAVTRDITIIVDQGVEGRQILDHLRKADTRWLEDVFLFDVYSGPPIAEGHKSLSVRLVYRSTTRTLEDARVNELHRNITQSLLTAFNAALPA